MGVLRLALQVSLHTTEHLQHLCKLRLGRVLHVMKFQAIFFLLRDDRVLEPFYFAQDLLHSKLIFSLESF